MNRTATERAGRLMSGWRMMEKRRFRQEKWVVICGAIFLSTAMMMAPGSASADTTENPISAIEKKIEQKKKSEHPAKKGDQKKPLKKPVAFKTFEGVLGAVDLKHHPMTVTAIFGSGTHCKRVFGGDLNASTVVVRGGKTVGVKSLQSGDWIRISYRRTKKSLIVVKIRIFT